MPPTPIAHDRPTRAETRIVCGVWRAFFNFIAFLVFGLNVRRKTSAPGSSSPASSDAQVIFAALIALCPGT